MTKNKEKILKTVICKQLVTLKGTSIKQSDPYQQKLCRPEMTGMMKVINGKNLQPRISNLVRLSFIFEGEIVL